MKARKWLSYGLGAVVGLIVAVLGYAWTWFEIRSARTFPQADYEITIPDDAESIAEGERLAQIRGCRGCHGLAAEGFLYRSFFDGTRWYAPDLASVVREYSNAEFVSAVRRGVRPDGTSVVGNMPSDMFQWLSDDDLGKIIAYLRSRVPRSEPLPDSRFGPLFRLGLMLSEYSVGGEFPAEMVDHQRVPTTQTPTGSFELGRYLGQSMCTQCHGPDLRGMDVFPNFFNPHLAITAAYSAESFRRLLRTGVPLSLRDLDLMDEVSIYRFSALNGAEIDALYACLRSLAATP